jgi:GNAT superfamily N-acetyltransferase
MANGRTYAEQYGWDQSYEALVARIVADFDPAAGTAWIAEADGERVGSVFCVPDSEPGTARLRLLVVTPAARGLGLGSALVERCLEHARAQGYERMTLWTNDVLAAARRIYQRAGFTLVKEEPHHSFGHDLVGQDWILEL